MGHPLAYPLLVTIGTLVSMLAWVPFADPEQFGMLLALAVVVLGYSGIRFAVALGRLPFGMPAAEHRHVAVRRVRQQYRLTSRSWLEFTLGGKTRWLPVYFDPALTTLTQEDAELSSRSVHIGGGRIYPSGRVRDREPVGRLIDNPTRPDPQAVAVAGQAARVGRRLLLDAQSAVVAPIAALLWVYVAGGGTGAFVAATAVAAATATWLAAIRGSDPS
ncbi:hypothetical protein LTV02_30970 [Nocardia yamanashiensis]|uniref:hypothetical protein n=1 Tax=Nocardia yamanashiensis TaxID=209247 RepID=UPI001E3CF575|nr:hypothetical protein [Nocardia yamanashiensis]UGT40394.1 hypothetical protein LTV02_30970 [Nocardia yamanashiensis]